MLALIAISFLFLSALLYFRIAEKCNIIDKPNERSSHNYITIRGGGIVFLLAFWAWSIYQGWPYLWASLGLLLVGLISIWDDIQSLPNSIRLTSHIAGALLLIYDTGLIDLLSTGWLLLVPVLLIGSLNAYNFMDGINGLAGFEAYAGGKPASVRPWHLGIYRCRLANSSRCPAQSSGSFPSQIWPIWSRAGCRPSRICSMRSGAKNPIGRIFRTYDSAKPNSAIRSGTEPASPLSSFIRIAYPLTRARIRILSILGLVGCSAGSRLVTINSARVRSMRIGISIGDWPLPGFSSTKTRSR